jgi:phosphoribosylaminoimidazole synthetase
MYSAGDYDLAGFCVGAVERSKVLTGDRVAAGDVILGLASSGVHSNGFSLVRRIIEDRGLNLRQDFDGRTLGDALLEPTRIYVSSLLPLVREGSINAMAHITGGGLLENIPRVLPGGLEARVDADAWKMPAIFRYLQDQGGIETKEMVRTFNCGIGMAIVVSREDETEVFNSLHEAGETIYRLGAIVEGTRGCTVEGSSWSATHLHG